jgi:hypothetical protein
MCAVSHNNEHGGKERSAAAVQIGETTGSNGRKAASYDDPLSLHSDRSKRSRRRTQEGG